MGPLLFLLAFVLACVGAVVIASALRIPRVRKASELYYRFGRKTVDALVAGEGALVVSKVVAGETTLEVPRTYERAVWIRYRLEDVGREQRTLWEHTEQVDFYLQDTEDGKRVLVDLTAAQLTCGTTDPQLLSEPFDDEMPALSEALPQHCQDEMLRVANASTGIYRIVVDRLCAGSVLVVAGTVTAGEGVLKLRMANTETTSLVVSTEGENIALSRPSYAWMAVGVVIGVATIGLALRLFLFGGPESWMSE
jgi:hypothetical protein